MMAAAYLSDRLSELIRLNLVDHNEVIESLFGAMRPLGTFSARIDMAFAMGLIGPAGRRDLHLIRKIRNDFGHVAGFLDFSQPGIASRCLELRHNIKDAADGPRAHFISAAFGICGLLIGTMIMSVQPTVAQDGPLGQDQRQRVDEFRSKLAGVSADDMIETLQEIVEMAEQRLHADQEESGA